MRILNAVSVNIRVQYSNRYAIVVVIIGFKKKKKHTIFLVTPTRNDWEKL